MLFPVQILVIRELSKEDNVWLSRLRSGLELQEDIEVLAKAYKGKEKHPLYEAAMDLIIRANWEKYQEVRKMCDALRELFADELEERESKGKLVKLITQVKRKMIKGQSASEIAEDLLDPLAVIQEIYDLITHNLENSTEWIYAKLTGTAEMR